MRARVAASGIFGRGAGVLTAGLLVSRSGWAAGAAACCVMGAGAAGGVTAATFFLAHPAPSETAATAIRMTPLDLFIVNFSINLFITHFARIPILFRQDSAGFKYCLHWSVDIRARTLASFPRRK